MQCYFITQYINFTNRIPTVQVSNIYMLNIFTDIKQSRQAIAIPHCFFEFALQMN